MDNCNHHSSSAELLTALREASAAFDKFLCDLDTFICEEEEVLARYEAEYCYGSIDNADQVTKEAAHDEP